MKWSWKWSLISIGVIVFAGLVSLLLTFLVVWGISLAWG